MPLHTSDNLRFNLMVNMNNSQGKGNSGIMKDAYLIHSGDHEGGGILYRHIALVQAKHT